MEKHENKTEKYIKKTSLHSVDIEVWSKLAKRARIMHIASKCAHDFDCDWQRVNAFSYCVTLVPCYFRKLSLTQIQKYQILLL